VGGGGGSKEAVYNQPCQSDAICPAFACSCTDGTFVKNAQRCLGAHCAEPADVCDRACGSHGGVVPLTAAAAPAGKIYGCVLTRYATWLAGGSGATARIYGTDTTAQGAVNKAYANCMSWGYTSLFCSDVSVWVVLEDVAQQTCQLTVTASSGVSSTYQGTGAGEAAARNATQETCYGGGSTMWTYWGCTDSPMFCQ
jgi:hypothetical protein